MTAEKRKPVAPFYAVAVLWVLSGLLLPLRTPSHYICMAVVSLLIFSAVSLLCRGESLDANPKPSPEPAPQTSASANTELTKMLQDGAESIAEMKRLNANIPAPGISTDITRLERATQQIFQAVQENPSKLPQIHRFMDYYLPTTLKLLNSYDRMNRTGVSGQNIHATLSKIETMIHSVAGAFEKQLDSLYGADAMDVSAEIAVLEAMMAREGLSGSSSVQDSPNDIHLEF
ncbi:MAG: hypothetical protein HFF84_04585 [Oscillibacter sp.]|nr:hypothetical protein [Oscillibacter sp.]